jgi:uncharacterized protein (DUF1800 family)
MALNAQEKMAHLYRRAGFGASPVDLRAALDRGLDAMLESLINYESVEEDVELKLAQLNPPLDLSKLKDLQTWWLFRLLNTRRPLLEKMTFFWHGHFATAISKVDDAGLMLQQNQVLRANALGNFRLMLINVSRDPAMLIWLDGNLNRKGAPNENFARELMELFTMGIGNYTERDVKEAARAFTGWQFLKDRTTGATTFFRNDNQHDSGSKTVLGKTGNLDGVDVLDLLVAREATARFIATKLFRFFIHDSPTPAQVEPFAQIYLQQNGEIRPVVRAILTSDLFWSEEAYLSKVKSPVEFVIGALKQISPDASITSVQAETVKMGQELFNPPTVKGWDGGASWINSTTMLARMNFANNLALARGSTGVNPAAIVSQNGLKSPEQIVDFLSQSLGPLPLDGDARADLVGYYNLTTGNTTADSMDTKVRGLLHLLMGTAEYQLA